MPRPWSHFAPFFVTVTTEQINTTVILIYNNNHIYMQQWQWLQILQENEGLPLGNKLTSQHVQFQTHKVNVRLVVQTLNSSVANAIELLDRLFQLPAFQNSDGRVEFLRTINNLFDMLNARNRLANGYKTSQKLGNKSVLEEIFTSSAH